MLIDDQKLNMKQFKEDFEVIAWKRVPRKLGPDHADFWYVGHFEDDERIIKVKISPSKRMAISESFKGMTIHGKVPPENYKGQLCDWGYSVEVIINDNILDRIKSASADMTNEPTIDTVSWE